MPADFDIKVVTPDGVAYQGRTISVVAPGTLGYLGILKNHAPLVTSLEKGALKAKDLTGAQRAFKIEGGFLEVLNNRVLVLTEKIAVVA